MSEAKHSPLLPCPFCGRSPTLVAIEPHEHRLAKFMPDHPGSAYIECGCGAGLIDADHESVTKRWNTRAATSLHHEFVAALEEALDEFGVSPNDCPSDHWAVRASALIQKAKQEDKP